MRIVLLLSAALFASPCSGTEDAPPAASAPATPVVVPTGTSPAAPSTPTPATGVLPAVGGVDPCLFGTWRLTPENARDYYRAIMSATGVPVEIVSVDGGGTTTLTPAGETSIDMAGLRVVVRMTSPGAPQMEMTMSFSGTGQARFTTSNGVIAFSQSTHAITGTATVTMNGRTTTVPWNQSISDSMAGAIRGEQTYRCSANQLILTMPNIPAPVVWVR